MRIEAVKASRSRVQIYATVGLSYYPFREDNVRALRDSVRALLPREFRKARIEIYTDRREIGELVPLACRNAAQLKKQIAKRQIVPFTNRSERPLVTLPRPPRPVERDFRGVISPFGRATDAISTSPKTVGNGSARCCGRPARTSIRRATCCRIWSRCSKTPGPA